METLIKNFRNMFIFCSLLFIVGDAFLIMNYMLPEEKMISNVKNIWSPLLIGLSSFIYLFYSFFKILFTAINEKPISSRLTFYIKFLVPYFMLVAWVYISTLAYLSKYSEDIFIPLFIFLMFLFCLTLILANKFYIITLDKDNYKIYSLFGLKRQFIFNKTLIKDMGIFAVLKADKNFYYIKTFLKFK